MLVTIWRARQRNTISGQRERVQLPVCWVAISNDALALQLARLFRIHHHCSGHA
jgi:hypothetical protein